MKPVIAMLVALAAAFAGAAFAQNAQLSATVTDGEGRPLADAVVVVVLPADGSLKVAGKPRDEAIYQVDKEFVPKVTAVLAGTSISFPNNDSVRHHVYSFSAAKKLELPLYQGVPSSPIVFEKPGVVVLGCNIHDWMVAYVYVSPSPHFAKTGADGKVVIGELGQRVYAVRVWHPQLQGDEEATRKTVDLSRSQRVEVAWSLALKPEIRVRRAPSSKQSGGY